MSEEGFIEMKGKMVPHGPFFSAFIAKRRDRVLDFIKVRQE